MLKQIATNFGDLGIGTRLIGGFLLLAAASVGVGYYGLRSMSEMNTALENTNANLIPSIIALTDLRGKGINTIQRNERTMILSTRNKNGDTYRAATTGLDGAWAHIREGGTRYESYPMSEKEKPLWTEFRARLEEFRRDHDATMAALKAGDLEKAEKQCLVSVPNATKMGDTLNALIDLQKETAKQDAAQTQSHYAAARTTMFVVVGCAVLAALGLGVFFRGLIVHPLDAAVKVLRAVSVGDLTHKAVVTSADEFGQMGTALNTTVTGLHAALQQDKVDWAMVGKQREQNADFAGQIAAVSKAQAVIEFKLDGTIVSANENFLRTLGYSLSEIQGRHHSMFAEPAFAASSEYREFWARLNRGEYVADEFKRIGKGGKEVWIQASYNPIFDLNGKPYKVVKYATDITANKNMAQKVKEDAAELEQKVGTIMVSVGAMAAGDFTQQVPDLGTDVVGQMATELNKAILSVRTALEGVREVSEQLADASGQLSAASDEISTGAQEQASSLEETASTLEEITATVKQNSDSAQQARQLASSSKDVAEKGGQVVGNAVEAMSEINHSSKRIADIITTIDEIAFQTNLLALNAAVEAARAGEQGRGFAVVASEVRNLAQRSATAAKEIKSLIEDSVKKVDAGTELVNRSGSTLEEIVTSVKRVTDLITEIAAAGKEQSVGIEQVNKAVSQMDTVTQRNASQTEEMSATAQTLTDQAGQLRDLVARFKLSDDGHGARRAAPKVSRSKAPATKPRPAVARAMSNGHSNGRTHELDRLGGDGGFTEF
ncbi:MCP four helix bundle domain-containing protein [Gemmata sp. G18]|uniref:MCP four helix bundle domain-containing protein n=1 Tax=Gemmata palustris TaxID=2822762 RepID=A0ABS5BPE9_9BACT|nr:methyl-accepting chemotaxis protein [Gemmata palustris]MBP3955596.1 MCP four helix bundle domain-containing protein [Gemmata palustris]